ncbi:MAG: sigma-54-dependent Fis family transcriptional regulator, partial [Rhodobacteraceae bacterium]|nr:sigma-54-dependent Fis family transcriptional regulator [Paracoccaceae bacterium]
MTPATAAKRALIVDDDKSVRQSMVDLLEAAGWEVSDIARAHLVADQLAAFHPDVIVSDVRMPGMSGLELLRSLDLQFAPPLVLISAHGDIQMAVEAMRDGAYSFVEKPYDPRRFLTILDHASDQYRMRQSNDRLQNRLMRLSGLDRVLLGQTDEITSLRKTILDLAEIDAPVMITGETGTGKELVARALHDLGPGSDGPFVALNCATLSPERFEADMFGLSGEAEGRLASASGGTLFLDEICSCPMPVQAQLLRVIEDKQVLPVGASSPVPLTFKVISATNEDVKEAVDQDRLRADLLFRLNTVVLHLPPLRQRRDDLTLLMAHFMESAASSHDVAPPTLGQDDLAAALSYDWPGNVRELRNVAERCVLAQRLGGQASVSEAIRSDDPVQDVPNTL